MMPLSAYKKKIGEPTDSPYFMSCEDKGLT